MVWMPGTNNPRSGIEDILSSKREDRSVLVNSVEALYPLSSHYGVGKTGTAFHPYLTCCALDLESNNACLIVD